MSPVLPPVSPNKNKQKHEGIRSILGTLLILLIAPILAITITAYVFQSYEVDGPSMQPTLETSDRLIIWKANKTWARITGGAYIPARTDIIVFVKRGMYDFNTAKEKQLIKRVIGLPGERVLVKDGVVTVFNEANPEGFKPDQTLQYGKKIAQPTSGNVDITVSPGEVFVMGDNRENSLDSRVFGAIPSTDIIGSLSIRILPLSEISRF
jgi:signal peptidase I